MTKVIYFPMALESAPLTYHETLKPDSIDSWEDLKKTFIDNFQGSMLHAGTCHDLSQVKQEENKTLRSYTRRLFEMRATITNITDEDVIHSSKTASARRTSTATLAASTPRLLWSSVT
jgi:hypothetical protein